MTMYQYRYICFLLKFILLLSNKIKMSHLNVNIIFHRIFFYHQLNPKKKEKKKKKKKNNNTIKQN